MKPNLVWTLENTGGGCTAFTAYRDGIKYMITDEDASAPGPTEACIAGMYDNTDRAGGDTMIGTTRPFSNSLAAALWLEHAPVPTVRDFLTTITSDDSRRRLQANMDRENTAAMMDCPAHTVCGKAIGRILTAAAALLDTIAEPDDCKAIAQIVARTCCTIYYG